MKTLSLHTLEVLYLCITITGLLRSENGKAQNLLDPTTQQQFVNPLPVPQVIDGRNGGTFTVSVSQFYQDLGLLNPTTGQPMLTRVWGYDGTYPGPTIVARKNVPLYFYWSNDLYNPSTLKPLPHLLPIDETIDWALQDVPNWKQYGVPVVTHLHGGIQRQPAMVLPYLGLLLFLAKRDHSFKKDKTNLIHTTIIRMRLPSGTMIMH